MQSKIFYLLIFLIGFLTANAQKELHEVDTKDKVEIIWAERLEGLNDSLRGDIRTLVGSVELKQKHYLFFCDSAIIFVDSSKFNAIGKVHIQNPDTLDIYSHRLYYNEITKQAKFRGNVILKDSSGTLETPYLDYDLNKDIGVFKNGGKFDDGKSILTSDKGVYYHKLNDAFFKGNVHLQTDKSDLYTDTLRYDTKTKIAYFVAPTRIVEGKKVINTSSGYYNTVSGEAYFGSQTKIDSENGSLEADNIQFDNKTKVGIAKGNVVWKDTVEQITIFAGYTKYNETSNTVIASEDPLLIDVNDGDTLFLSADTLITIKIPIYDSLANQHDTLKTFKGYKNVKLFQNRISGLCDSLYYSDIDSVFRLYHNPILWVDSVQFFSDSIKIFTKKGKADEMHLYQNAMIINQNMPTIYSQIKGRTIKGFFEKDTLRRVDVNGNAESIYYLQDDSSAYIGANKTVCGEMKIYFEKNTVHEILFLTQPEALFTPMQLVNPSTNILGGFRWELDSKPKSKFDIIRNNNAAQIEHLKQIGYKYVPSNAITDSIIIEQKNIKDIIDTLPPPQLMKETEARESRKDKSGKTSSSRRNKEKAKIQDED